MHNHNGPGDQWDQPQASPQHTPPASASATAATSPSGHPLADNNLDIGAFLDALKLSAQRLKDGSVILALALISLVSLVFGLGAGVLQFIAHLVMDDFGAGLVGLFFAFLGLITLPFALLIVTALQSTLYRPAQRAMTQGVADAPSPVSLIKDGFKIIVPVGITVVALGFAIGLGSVLCFFPGLIAAFLFSQAPYLVAVHDRGMMDAFKESFERAKKHWHVLLLAIGAIFVASIVGGFAIGCSFGMSQFPPVGYLIAPVANWAGTLLLTVLGFVIATAAFTTIDELEGLATVQR